MMRRLICFLLVLVMTLSVACPVLAATEPSPDPTAPTQPGGGYTPPSSSPKTGDQIMMYVIIMVVALLVLAAVVLFSRKAFKK